MAKRGSGHPEDPRRAPNRAGCAEESADRTVAGAHASANLYSLLQSCMVNGIDTWRYLRDLLIALAQAKTVGDYVALLPWRLAKPIEVNAGQLPRHNT